MRDFEVVVIDDGSTDNSVEVVENFKPRFNGRLHVIKLKKNTGNPGLPRNVGIQFARGKYIAFLDSDDLFTKTALEELSTLAEKYQAEVINTNIRFRLWDGKIKSVDAPEMTDFAELTNPDNFSKALNSKFQTDKPIFETNDLAERVKKFLIGGYAGYPYSNFYRRDFLIKNQITFPHVFVHTDQIFTFHGMCLAEKILRVPNINYIVRPRAGSIMRERLNVDKEVHKSLRIYIDGFNVLKKIMDDIKFFDEHPDYRYAVYDWIFLRRIGSTIQLYTANPLPVLNSIVKEEFRAESDNLVTASAYMFNTLNLYRLQLLELLQENDALRNELKRYQTAQ